MSTQEKSKFAILYFIVITMVGCASGPVAQSENDKFEKFNRAIFKYNQKADEYVLKPIAKGYKKALPGMVRTGIGNFFRIFGSL